MHANHTAIRIAIISIYPRIQYESLLRQNRNFYYSARSIHLVLSRPAWKSSSFASTFRSRPTPLFYLQLESRILNPRRQKQLDDPRLAMFFLLENKHLFVNRSRQFFDNFEFTISNSIDLNSSRVFRTDFPRKVERMDLIIPTKLFRIGN